VLSDFYKNKERLELPLISCLVITEAVRLSGKTKAAFTVAAGLQNGAIGRYMRAKENGGNAMGVNGVGALLTANNLAGGIAIGEVSDTNFFPLESHQVVAGALKMFSGSRREFAKAGGLPRRTLDDYMRSQESGGVVMTIDRLGRVLAANGLRACVVLGANPVSQPASVWPEQAIARDLDTRWMLPLTDAQAPITTVDASWLLKP
jgi:hypothetical protein